MTSINLNKLTTLIDPKKEDLLSLGNPLGKKELNLIKKFISEVNFEEDNKTPYILKKIAYSIKNPHEKAIVLDFIDDTLIIHSGLEEYIAAIIRGDTQIDVFTYKNNIELNELLQLDQIDVISLVEEKKYNLEDILSFQNIKKTEDENFYIKKLKKCNINNFKETFEEIPDNIRSSINFKTILLKSFSKDELLKLDNLYWVDSRLLSESLLDNYFFTLWNLSYKDFFKQRNNREGIFTSIEKEKERIKEYQDELKRIDEEFTFIFNKYRDFAVYDNYALDSISEYKIDLMGKIADAKDNVKSHLKKVDKKELNFILDSIEAYFNDIDWVINNIANIDSFYKSLPKEIKNNENLIKLKLNNKNNPDEFFDSIPSSYFDNEENCINYFSILFSYNNSKEIVKPLVKNLTGNKDKLISCLSKTHKFNYNFIDTFINMTWVDENLKKDIDVLKELILKNDRIYESLDNSVKLNKDLFQVYIYKSSAKLSIVPPKLWGDIKDKSLILSLLENEPFLLDNDSPTEWKRDKDIILICKRDVKFFKHNLATWEKIIGSNIDTAKEFLDAHPSYYTVFSKEQKLDESLALSYIKKTDISEINAVPKEVFGSKDFCVKALMKNIDSVSLIPSIFLKDIDFLLKVCKEVDNEKISKSIFSNMPSVQDLFEKNEINSDYEKFLLSKVLEVKLNNKKPVIIKKIKV